MAFVTTYAEFKQPSLRAFLRHHAINALAIKANEQSIKQKRVTFTCFHSYYTDTEQNLRKQLEFLAKHFEFISYSEGVRRVQEGDIDGNYLCISSDDGYKSFFDACKIFDDYGAKALVFANPSVIGETNLETLTEYNRARLQHGPMEFLNWQEIEDLCARGHEVGNHTLNHRNIANCTTEELEEQIGSAYEMLKEHLGPDLHFAWPYGTETDISDEALKLIYEVGHVSAASCLRGSHYKALELKDIRYLLREQIEPFEPVQHLKYYLAKSYA